MAEKFIEGTNGNAGWMEKEEWAGTGKLLEQAQIYLDQSDPSAGVKCLNQVWETVKKVAASRKKPLEISDLDNETEYEYNIQMAMYDLMILYGQLDLTDACIEFCREMLDTFVWEEEDADAYKRTLAELLHKVGRKEESLQVVEKWLEEKPENSFAQATMASYWVMEKEYEKARALLESKIDEETECDEDNFVLFYQMMKLYQELGEVEKSEVFKKKYDAYHSFAFEEFMKGPDAMDEDIWGEDFESEAEPGPIVKEKKIYPNDPCSCGSGKKYKKCCGRK